MILVLVFDEWLHFHEYSCGSIAYLTVRSSPTCNFWSCLHLHFYSFQCYRGTLHHRWSLPGYLGSLQWSSESADSQLFATSPRGGSSNLQGRRRFLQWLHWSLDPGGVDGLVQLFFVGKQHQIYFTSVLSLIDFLPRVVLFKISRLTCLRKRAITYTSIWSKIHPQEDLQGTERIISWT